MAEIKLTSASYNRKPVDSDTSLIELPWCGKINLRGNPQNRQFIKKAESVFGLALPMEANTAWSVADTESASRWKAAG